MHESICTCHPNIRSLAHALGWIDLGMEFLIMQGELAYNCRNCQADGTCVLCEKCFRESNHEGHDFSFHLAGPGGCCDCGDSEAWSPSGACPRHSGLSEDASSPSASDPAASMEPGLRASLQATVAALGRCLQEMAVSVAASYGRTDKEARPGESEEAVKSPSWSVVLHNDDVHTYDEVSASIKLLTRVQTAQARRMTQDVSSVARMLACHCRSR